ncbi:hypothetical protein JCM5353_005273 [Sporobolomyces roseus]
MSTRSSSPSNASEQDGESSSRLAALEALLSSQLYSSTTSTSNPPQVTEPTPIEPTEPPLDVAFRLFSTQKAPTRVTIREASTPPPISIDPRIRSTEDEDPQTILLRTQRIKETAIEGSHILSQSTLLPIPHSPSYRLTTRTLHAPLHASSSSTRAPLPLPSLAYLNSRLPSKLHKISPAAVPCDEKDAPREPNEGLISKGPYILGKKGEGMKRRFPLALEEEGQKKKVRLVVVPVLGEEKVEKHVWTKKELERKKREKKRAGEKARRVRRKVKEGKIKDRLREQEGGGGKVELVGKKGEIVGRKVEEKKERKKRTVRLSKERRERIKKRTTKGVAKA